VIGDPRKRGGLRLTTHSVVFRMVENPESGTVVIYEDGTGSNFPERAVSGKPLLIEVEGTAPNGAQLKFLGEVFMTFNAHFGFRVVAFCPTLLQYQSQIIAPSNIPA
jgi:hypothetical protein